MTHDDVSPAAARGEGYTVVARRYRPQTFDDVVGQDHVVQALKNAITAERISHAYLFAGTRGVGKTSIARIFAKCLNCVHGPTVAPCLKCEICKDIAVGQDVDVIEIDGASNNGVESVRELRQNAGLRPARARYKIYYIDEVHMLSTGAFNALLKTLEEPPPHVKFFFATTEPNKIPITVLSRCQRFDFAGIGTDQIALTLAKICGLEGVEAEPDALQLVARRAAGSLRDAESLLDQLLATESGPIDALLVQRLLGLAGDDRLLAILEALAAHDLAETLLQTAGALGGGVQPADLLNGLIEYLRDVMVTAAGADTVLLAAGARQKPRLQTIVEHWPLDSILAALQILAEARGRLRGSVHGRVVVELALARVARLDDFIAVGALVARLEALESGAPPPPPPASGASRAAAAVEKKKHPGPAHEVTAAPARAAPPRTSALDSAAAPPQAPVAAVGNPKAAAKAAAEDDAADTAPDDLKAVLRVWPQVLEKVGARFSLGLTAARPTAIEHPNVLVIPVDPLDRKRIEPCETPEGRAKITQTLGRLAGREFTVRFDHLGTGEGEADALESGRKPTGMNAIDEDPFAGRVASLFEARRVQVDVEDDPAPPD